MSKAVKQLVKEAKQAYAEKQLKVAEEKCHVSTKPDHCLLRTFHSQPMF